MGKIDEVGGVRVKKAWTDLKSFITVVIMFLFAYCIVLQIPIDETLKLALSTVIGFFLGAQSQKLNN